MSNSDSPAGSTGGPVPVPALNDLPEKMRVHALAKLLGRTSREVISALAGLGVEVRTAQSSIDRKVAEQVVTALAPAAEQAASAPAEAPSPARLLTPEPAAAPVTDTAPVADPAPEADTPPQAGAPLVPVFAPPAPLFQAPTRPARTRRPAADQAGAEGPAPEAAAEEAETEAPARRTRRRPARQEEPERAEDATEDTAQDPTEDTAEDATAEPSDDGDDSDDEDGAARRRRRRGRRGRGRGRGGEGGDDENGEDGEEQSGSRADTADTSDGESDTDESDGDADGDSDQADGEAGGSRRRRRRRRRKGSGDEGADGADDDPPGTVTRVRAPREARTERDDSDGDGVQSVRGSTRLEAKRQRRRDGRDAGRRRVPILSEAEFLARRESVDRAMVVRERGDRMEIAVLEDDVLVEHFVAGRDGGSMVGNIYLGRVQNVLPSMEAAFVDIGRGRNAVLYAGEVDWDAAGLGGKARRIEQALSSGDSVLVQVTKDPIGHKGARLTTQISLAGRFLVYVPSGGAAGISRKLPDVERKRLKDMLKEIVPSEAGVIIRTASEGVSHEALERDVRRLQVQWDVVKGKAEQTGPNKPKAPVLLYEEPDLLLKVVRDQFNEDFSRLVVQGDDAWDTLQNYVGHVAPELAERLHRHVGTTDVFTEYRIDEQLLKALDRKVWLPSGGTLVIDRTEAMTVIDVNTGKYTGSGGNLEETVTRNNLEAAEEVVRQLRLRDIGGIIVVDFIDMVLEANRDLVLRRLTECLSRDRTRHQVAEVTSLGLVQMTRKRVGGGLLEHFSTPCEHCRGRGVIVSAEPVEEKGDPGRSSDARPADSGPGRRSRGGRGGRRGEGDQDRNGHDGRTDEPARNGNGQQDRAGKGGPELVANSRRNAVVTPDTASATVDTGAPAAPVETAAPVVETTPVHLPGAPADVAADTVEEIVVEQSVAAQATAARDDAAPPEITTEVPVEVPEVPAVAEAPAEAPAAGGNGRPARRRGRVTRTAGAPAAADGDKPAAVVVTVPAAPQESEPAEAAPALVTTPAVAVAPVPEQPEPAPATRPRRTRRAASRPAGPPVAEAGGDPV